MTIVNELEAALASVSKLTAERDGFSAQLADAVKLIQTLRDEAGVKDAAHTEALKVTADALTAEQAAHSATKTDLEAKTKALANPAFAQAAVAGDKNAVAVGGAEAIAVKSKDELEQEYRKLTDPLERKAFRTQHAKELGLA